MSISFIQNDRSYPGTYQIAGKIIEVRLAESPNPISEAVSEVWKQLRETLKKQFAENNCVNEFLKVEMPSAKLMNEILGSTKALNQLLEKTKEHPEVLLKQNKEGQTILSLFAYSHLFFPIPLRCMSPEPDLESSNRTLQRLIVAAPWGKDDLLKSLKKINPYYINKTCWLEIMNKIENRSDLDPFVKSELFQIWQAKGEW